MAEPVASCSHLNDKTHRIRPDTEDKDSSANYEHEIQNPSASGSSIQRFIGKCKFSTASLKMGMIRVDTTWKGRPYRGILLESKQDEWGPHRRVQRNLGDCHPESGRRRGRGSGRPVNVKKLIKKTGKKLIFNRTKKERSRGRGRIVNMNEPVTEAECDKSIKKQEKENMSVPDLEKEMVELSDPEGNETLQNPSKKNIQNKRASESDTVWNSERQEVLRRLRPRIGIAKPYLDEDGEIYSSP